MDVAAAQTGPASTPSEAAVSLSPEIAARVRGLADTLVDTSGASSLSDQMHAYKEIHRMVVTGELRGLGADKELKAYVDKARTESAVGVQSRALQQQFALTMSAAGERGSNPPAAGLRFFESLSADDQQLLFQTQINAADFTGRGRYGSVDDFKDHLNAAARLRDYADAARANGATKQNDATFAAAMQLAESRTQDFATWAKDVFALLGDPRQVRDTVQLSPEAKALLGGGAADASKDPAVLTLAEIAKTAANASDRWNSQLLTLFGGSPDDADAPSKLSTDAADDASV